MCMCVCVYFVLSLTGHWKTPNGAKVLKMVETGDDDEVCDIMSLTGVYLAHKGVSLAIVRDSVSTSHSLSLPFTHSLHQLHLTCHFTKNLHSFFSLSNFCTNGRKK